MRSFTDALLLLLSHDSFCLAHTHTHTVLGKGCVLVIKQGGPSLPSQTPKHPEGKGAGLAWYLIVTAVSHWQCELIYQACTWTVRAQAHATKPYAQTHLFTGKQEVIFSMYLVCCFSENTTNGGSPSGCLSTISSILCYVERWLSPLCVSNCVYDVYFMFTPQEKLHRCFMCFLNKPQKNKNCFFFCCKYGKKCQNWTKPKTMQ